jgi:glycerol-3-phosphate dehydrogenase (NAD(P)+)
MRQRRDNPVYLPGVPIPDEVVPVSRVEEALEGAELVVAAVPTPFAREVYSRLSRRLRPEVPVVLAAKGIEEETLALPVQIAREALGEERRCAVLSGPSFAVEVARGQPTAAVVAADSFDLAAGVQAGLSGRNLRLYTNQDVTGVQLAGALKNVIAIAAGIVDGLGLGQNTLAALLTRGLAEMTRLGLAMGGQPSTFSGLAGMGDLVLTCGSGLSRNRTVGLSLGRGERLGDILARTRMVAEGVRTARSARELARRAGVEMPIVEEVYRILYEDHPPREALDHLMSRPLTSEDLLPAEPGS